MQRVERPLKSAFDRSRALLDQERAELVVKVKEPQAGERAMLREGQVMFTYLHLAELDLAPCRGCFQCFVRGEDACPLVDDRSRIAEALADRVQLLLTHTIGCTAHFTQYAGIEALTVDAPLEVNGVPVIGTMPATASPGCGWVISFTTRRLGVGVGKEPGVSCGLLFCALRATSRQSS